ncbi:hypothetical protein [Pseudomonas sp.]|uniref:hypothetical protein n=1 Tax=Pseudomonas sp. TaxID=306 RepID=UPI0028A7E6C5|nr:hypothetical protein [Pseudomonas sp.]
MNKTISEIKNGFIGLYQLIKNNFGVFTFGFALYCACSYLINTMPVDSDSAMYVVSFISCFLYIYIYAVLGVEKSKNRFRLALWKMPALLFKAMLLLICLFFLLQSVLLLVTNLIPDLISSLWGYLADFLTVFLSNMSDIEKAKALWEIQTLDALVVAYDKTSLLSLSLVSFLLFSFIALFFVLLSLPLALNALDNKSKLFQLSAFSSLYGLFNNISVVCSLGVLLFTVLGVCLYFSLSYFTPIVYMLFVFFSYYIATKDVIVKVNVKVLTDKEKADAYLAKVSESKKKAAANN